MAYKKSGYHIIYKATTPSGKIYIGYTHHTLQNRISMHFRDARQGIKRPFFNALRKYGKSIKWEILSTYQTEKYALNRECYFINKYETYNNPKVGYNCTTGGQGNPGLKRLSQRIKIIDNHGRVYLGYTEIAEKLNIPIASVKNCTRFGYWCSGYYFSKYKDGMLKAESPKTTPKRVKKIVNVTTGETFEKIRDAAEKYNISEQLIGRVCKGKRKSTGGFVFVYVDKELTL